MAVIRMVGALAALLAAPEARDTVRSSGPLGIEAPARVDLVETPAVWIRIRERAAVGASVGTVSAVEPDPGGGFRARWEVSTRAPQHAIVWAAGSSNQELVRVALHGKAEVHLRTEPRASVMLRVGELEMGPLAAGADGRLSTEVTVAPGVREATALATDALGNVTHTAIDLAVPPASRLAAHCADGASRVVVFALDEQGRPAGTADFHVEASIGRTSAARRLAPGVFAATLSLPEETREEHVAVTVRGPTSTASCRAPVPGEPPVSLEVSLSPERYRAGSGEPVAVTVRGVYAGKRRPEPFLVELRPEIGEATPPATKSTLSTATWRLPDGWNGRHAASVSARVPDAKASGTAKLTLESGPPVRLDVETSDSCMVADGTHTSSLWVRVYDRHGNPTASSSLNAAGDVGRVGAFASSEPGTYHAVFTAPVLRVPRRETIVVREGMVEGTTEIALFRPPRFALLGAAGWLSGPAAGPVVMVGGRAPLPRRPDDLGIEIEVAGHRGSRDGDRVASFPLLARGYLRIPGPVSHFSRGAECLSRAVFELGAGGGGAFVSGRNDRFVPLASAHAGLDFHMRGGRLFWRSTAWLGDADARGILIVIGYRAEL